MLRHLQVTSLDAALAVLTAMITPALLISAAGTLILSTTTRLGRVVDRARKISDKMEDLFAPEAEKLLLEEKRAMLLDQMGRLRVRAVKLQRSLTSFYLAAGMFVMTSVATGLLAIFQAPVFWVPVVMAVLGAFCLMYGCLVLITEASSAVDSLHVEMDFLGRFVREHAEHPERTGARGE